MKWYGFLARKYHVWYAEVSKMSRENEHKKEANKKWGRENESEMIQILAKDEEYQLGMLAVKRGETIQRKHIKACCWGIYAIEGRR